MSPVQRRMRRAFIAAAERLVRVLIRVDSVDSRMGRNGETARRHVECETDQLACTPQPGRWQRTSCSASELTMTDI